MFNMKKTIKEVFSKPKKEVKKVCPNCEDSGLECNTCGHRNA